MVPSKDLVVVRMGNSAGQSLFAASSFDNELWEYINKLECISTNNDQTRPLPSTQLVLKDQFITIHTQLPGQLLITSLTGQIIWRQSLSAGTSQMPLPKLMAGTYLATFSSRNDRVTQKWTVGSIAY